MAPQKAKYILDNYKPLKTLSKALIQKTKLRNKFFKAPTDPSSKAP